MMDARDILSAAEELADSPDPIDSTLAVALCYLATRSIANLEDGRADDLIRAAYAVASTWERSNSDGARLVAMPVLDRVLLLAASGELDVDARDLDEINRSRYRAGEPFWSTTGVS